MTSLVFFSTKIKITLAEDIFKTNIRLQRKYMAHRRLKDIFIICVMMMNMILVIILARIEKTRQVSIAKSFIM